MIFKILRVWFGAVFFICVWLVSFEWATAQRDYNKVWIGCYEYNELKRKKAK